MKSFFRSRGFLKSSLLVAFLLSLAVSAALVSNALAGSSSSIITYDVNQVVHSDNLTSGGHSSAAWSGDHRRIR